MQTRVRSEKIPDQLGFVRREVVDNDVDFLIGWATIGYLPKEVNELAAGMAGGGFSDDLAGSSVQRSLER